MKRRITPEDFAKLPAEVQEHYLECKADGGYWLEIEGDSIRGLISAMDRHHADRAATQGELDRLLAEAPERAATIEDLKTKVGESAAKVTRFTDDIGGVEKELADREAERADLERRAAQAPKLMAALAEQRFSDWLTAAIKAHNGIPELLGPLVKPFLRRIETDDESAKPNCLVLGHDGEPRYSFDGQPVTLSQFLTECRTFGIPKAGATVDEAARIFKAAFDDGVELPLGLQTVKNGKH